MVALNSNLGWRFQDEDFSSLRSRLMSPPPQLFGGPLGDVPARFDPRDKLKREDQRQRNSCMGNSLATILEQVYGIKVGDWNVQRSRWWCYIKGQELGGGYDRQDNGATLEGGLRAVTELGCPPESLAPYPADNLRYEQTLKFSPEAIAAAGDCKVKSAIHLSEQGDDSYEATLRFLQMGLGGIHIGMMWTDAMANSNGRVKSYRPTRGGGHALAIVGWTDEYPELVENGLPALIMANSHSDRWGIGGYAFISRSAWQGFCSWKWFTAIGYSDLDLKNVEIKPRPILTDFFPFNLAV